MENQTKLCVKCQVERETSEFIKEVEFPDERASWCKHCCKRNSWNTPIICRRCKKEKIHRSKGLCNACWLKERFEILQLDPNYYIPTPESKVCKKCKTDKPSSDFAANNNLPDRLQYWCKECLAKQYQVRRQSKDWVEKERQRGRDKWANDPEFKETQTLRRREYDKNRWHSDEEYRKKKNEIDSLRIRPNTDHTRKLHRESRQRLYDNMPADTKEMVRLRGRHFRHRKKAIAFGLPYDFTISEWFEVVKENNDCCTYCGNQYDAFTLEQEHKTPPRRGGGYTRSNITSACHTCNMRKQQKTDEEFREYIKLHPQEFRYAKSF